MTQRDWMELLLRLTWWSWTDGDRSWHSIAVHVFNFVEGVAWWMFSALVLRRHLRFRKCRAELLYSLAFLSFGVTDFIEAYALTSWLIWIKLVNLIVLWRLRSTSLGEWYPENRLF
jgi:hypothetical protein